MESYILWTEQCLFFLTQNAYSIVMGVKHVLYMSAPSGSDTHPHGVLVHLSIVGIKQL